jgi:2-dehydropantoate 2-reductase
MRIAVMGAGAVGCYFGALLAKAGHEVELIARPAHVEAVQARGLALERQSGTEHVRLAAGTEAAGVAGAELVLLCVKSMDTETAGAAMAPHLAEGAVILSLQNGVGNAGRLAARLGRPVLPAAVYVAAEMAGPGHVRHHGRGELTLGAGPKAEDMAALLTGAGIPTEVSAAVETVLWTKLVVNCAYNAVSALARAPYGRILAAEGSETLLRNVVAECAAVAAACGIALPPDQLERTLAVGRAMPGQISSTAQDMLRGRPTEIGYLNGHVVRLGVELGIPTPVNQALLTLVRMVEASPPPALTSPG